MKGAKDVNAPGMKIEFNQEKAFESELGKENVKDIKATQGKARDAAEIIDVVHQGRKLLDSGVITGVGADYLTKFGQALSQIGFDESEDKVANTQAYTSLMANNVGKLIKQFGSGTGLSDADREFATAMAGGKIGLNEKAIRRILDIQERQARWTISRHNQSVKGVKSMIPLTVEMPAAYTKGAPTQPIESPQSGKAQPQSGPMLKALPQGAKQIGTSGGKPVYQSPDGKKWIGE
jgi:hypothetical protein